MMGNVLYSLGEVGVTCPPLSAIMVPSVYLPRRVCVTGCLLVLSL